MTYKSGKVLLAAHVDPAIREAVRQAAKDSKVTVSELLEHVLQLEIYRRAARSGPWICRSPGCPDK